MTEKLDRPLQTVNVDVFHYENTKYLSMVDRFSMTEYLYRIKSKSANDVAEIPNHRFEIILGVDIMRGTPFRNQLWRVLKDL